MLLTVDFGVDVLAHRAETFFHIQVKTIRSHERELRFDATRFDKLLAPGANLIVVIWPRQATPWCVVLPASLLRMMTSGGFRDPDAPVRLRKGSYRVKIIARQPGRVYVRNLQNDYSRMVNRFDRIEDQENGSTALPSYASWSDTPRQLLEIDP